MLDYFKNETKSKGVITTFLNRNEILKLLSRFKIIELKEEITKNYLNNKNISFWVIVAQKK